MEEVKYSSLPETRYYKFTFTLLGIIGTLMLLFLVIILTAAKLETSVIVSTSLITFLFFGVLTLYYFLRYNYYLHLEPKYIQVVKLEKVVSSYTSLLAFEVEMEIDSKIEKVETLAVFNSGFIKLNPIENYSNKTVRVGYDSRFKVCVILEILK